MKKIFYQFGFYTVFNLFCLIVVIGGAPTYAAEITKAVRVSDEFFGLHIRWGAISTPWPFVRFNSWRVITAETEWRGLEPQRGVWRFEALDRAVALSEEHGVDVLLTLGQTPPWASARPTEPSANSLGNSAEPIDIADWENYVRTVFLRYRGRIKYYELWNEPYYSDLRGYTTKGHFSGSVAEMLKLANIARKSLSEIDPAAKLISPSCTGGEQIGLECTEAFLKAGGGYLVDVIGFHFYMSPERIPIIAKKIRALMLKYKVPNLPLWNTESGYLVNGTNKATFPISKLGDPFDFVLTQEMLPGYVLRSMVLAALSGVSRYYHFSWDIPTMHLMWKKGTEPTPASTGYAQAVRWLRGSTLSNLKNAGGIISCDVTSGVGHKGVLVWSAIGKRTYSIPGTFRIAGYETIGGAYIDDSSAKSIEVSESPILIRQEAALW